MTFATTLQIGWGLGFRQWDEALCPDLKGPSQRHKVRVTMGQYLALYLLPIAIGVGPKAFLSPLEYIILS